MSINVYFILYVKPITYLNTTYKTITSNLFVNKTIKEISFTILLFTINITNQRAVVWYYSITTQNIIKNKIRKILQ